MLYKNEKIAKDVMYVKNCMLHTLETEKVEESVDEVLFQEFFEILACGNETEEDIVQTLESEHRESFLIAFTSFLVVYYTTFHKRDERLQTIYLMYSRCLKEIL